MIQKVAVIKLLSFQKCRHFLFSMILSPASNLEIIFLCLRRVFRVILKILRSFGNFDRLTFSSLNLRAISYFALSDKVTYLDLLFDYDFL